MPAQLEQMKEQLEQTWIFNATNSEIQKYYQNKRKFHGVYSRNNLPKLKDVTYVINLDEFRSVGTHWIALNVDSNNAIHFDGFGV